MKKILETILAVYARWTLGIHKPKIVGITGSVGKTSTKDAVALVLATKYRVGASYGNFNSQVGLPLSILDFRKSGGTKYNLLSAWQWFTILFIGFFRIFRADFPEVLVLEMGIYKAGDIAELLQIVKKIDVVVITDIGISHLENFPNPEALAREKLSILQGLDKNGVAVLNADNQKVLAGKNQTQATVLTYGFDSNAEISQTKISLSLPRSVGKAAIYAGLAAIAVGKCFGISEQVALKALEKYEQPAGRLRLIEGLKNSQIIDDTYNAAPASTVVAIDALAYLGPSRRLAVLGEMAELGQASETGHKEVGQKIFDAKLDLVFLIGEKTQVTKKQLDDLKFSGQVFWFKDHTSMIDAIKQNLTAGDVVLVKGSQAARMEKVVKAIMAHPDQAGVLLVRQEKEWQN